MRAEFDKIVSTHAAFGLYHGWEAEWFNAAVLKTAEGYAFREFESHPIRTFLTRVAKKSLFCIFFGQFGVLRAYKGMEKVREHFLLYTATIIPSHTIERRG